MKNIIFRSGSLRMGGLERILVETLQNLDLKKNKIHLLIEDNSEIDNFFINFIPKEIKIYFLKAKETIDSTHYYRERRKKNLYYKIMYNYKMSVERKMVIKKTLSVLNEIEKEYGKIDTFIDYDWGARRYIEKIKIPKKIIWIHNSLPKLLKKDRKIKRFGRYLEGYDEVIAICDDMKKEMEILYPNIKEKITRIYNGYDFENIREKSNEKIKEEDKILINEDYILAISRLDLIQKDYLTLLSAYKKALEKGFEKKLYILGDGEDRKKIEEEITKMSLEKKVILLGRRLNPYPYIKNASFFVHASKYEGFGLVILEALILDKLVIASDCPVGPRELLDNGNSGILVEPENVEELKEALLSAEKILKENSFRENIKKHREKFNMKNLVKEIETLF